VKQIKRNSINVLTIKDAYASIAVWLTNKTKGQTMKETNKKTTKSNKKPAAGKLKAFGFGILGLLMLVVVMSIAFSSYVVWAGTTGTTPKLLLVPQIVFAAANLLAVFIFAAVAVSKTNDN